MACQVSVRTGKGFSSDVSGPAVEGLCQLEYAIITGKGLHLDTMVESPEEAVVDPTSCSGACRLNTVGIMQCYSSCVER